MPTKKKEDLLGRSRALIGGRKLTSLSDFQETPTKDEVPKEADTAEVSEEFQNNPPSDPMNTEEQPIEVVRTNTYKDTQRRTKTASKVVRENFRFTEELSSALERYVAERRLKKNTVVEIALEQHLKQEGYL